MPRHFRPELAEVLRRTFDTDVPGSFDTVAPEIVPVYPLDVESPQLFAIGRAGITGGAGARGKVAIHQPDIGGLVTFVHQLEIYSTTAQQIHLCIHDDASAFAAASTVAAQSQLRGRPNPRVTTPQTIISNLSTGGVLGTLVYSTMLEANISRQITGLNIALVNPWALIVTADTDATFIVASFLFSEREQLPRERVP